MGDLQKQVDETKKRVKNEEELINGINQAGVKVSADANRLREEIKTLECECEKAEDDKSTKDNQIRTLREEIAHQEELIGKPGKEKKGAGEGRQKTEEDIQAMEDRCNHLGKVKGNLNNLWTGVRMLLSVRRNPRVMLRNSRERLKET